MPSPTTNKMTKQERKLLLVLAAIQFTNIMDFMIMMPLGPQLMRTFSITPAQFSVIVSAYAFSGGIFGFLGSFVIDRFDRKTFLLWTYLGFCIGTLACAIAPSYIMLVAARTLTGFFGGVLGALVLSVVADAIVPQRRGHAMGIVMTAFSVASVVGVPFGLFLANKLSWHAPFFFLVFSCLIVLVAIYYVVPELRSHLVEKGPLVNSPINNSSPAIKKKRISLSMFSILTDIAKTPNQVWALALTGFLMLGQFTIVPFLSPYMVSNVGFKESDLTYIYLLGGLATIFTSPLVGKFSDRRGSAYIFRRSAVLALFPILAIAHLGHVGLPIALALTTLFFILGNARFVPAMALVSSTVSPQKRGGFMSINSCFQQLFAGLASFLAGLIVSKNAAGELVHYDRVSYLTVVASIICILISFRVKPLASERSTDAATETMVTH